MTINVSTASANFTRPADTTAYGSGDLVANSTTAGSVTPLSFTLNNNVGGPICIRRARITKSDTDVANATFRIHLFTASPTVSNGDNGALVPNQQAAYLGYIELTTSQAFAAAAGGWATAAANAELFGNVGASATLYGLLEARGAYTPATEEVFTVLIEIQTES